MMPILSIISKLFSLYVYIPRRSSSSSLSSYHSVSHEFLFLPFCLLRLYAEGIYFSTHTLTTFSVFVEWCSSSFCFHPPCPKHLDWIGVQSNWFSLTFSKSTFQTIPVVECPPSSTSYVSAAYSTVLQIRVFTILFFYTNFIFPLSNSPRLLNASFPMAIQRFTSSWYSIV